ncbi:MAG TPA: response regulator [Burkholderiales bacterium]|nr:response regulator [Burkholderiales bacterium]
MAKTGLNAIGDDDAFAITGKGNAELKTPGTALTTSDLQVLVLLDGFSTVAQVAQRVPNVSRAEVDASLKKMLGAKLIVNTIEPESDAMGSGFSTISVPAGFFSGLTEATPEAEGGTSILKQKGYYVRIAKRADAREAKEGWRPTVLVIDDDPDLQKLIRTYFVMEGLQSRAAYKRDDILAALRIKPMPDLVLLDVQLPDANGFDLLARFRDHPVLKTLPIVMLTAEASREAVLKGLHGGADGYITKPFEPDVLVTAVKAVLGLSPAPAQKKS